MRKRPESPALDRASRAWVLLGAALCLLPLLLALPSRIAIGVAIIGSLVVVLSWQRRVPAWVRLPITASLVGLVMVTMEFQLGRDTGCALLAAMLAAKPLELRSLRDGRSLLGFALFAPFGTFLLDQGPLSLVLGLVAAMAVLVALLRLSEQESREHTQPDTLQRLATVLRLVAIGLPLALAAFWLFPRMPTPLWGVPQRAIATPGLSDSMAPGEWLDLMVDDSPALRVVFFGDAPPPSEMYWRGPVLTDFDGREWTASRWLRHLPPADVMHGAQTWDYQMDVEPSDRPWLVSLEMPRDLPEGVRSSWEHSLTTERPLHAVTRWRMQSAPVTGFEPELSDQVRLHSLRLPAGFNPRTVALGQEWRAELGDRGERLIVERAMRMIRDEFGYTLSTPLPGRHTADEFLFEWKQGFCEHFSSAFVILMRASGIPARVVTGYAGGERNRFGGYWVVRNMDAHAWAEVWLEGRGWVRVDPTAAVAPERIYDTLEDRRGMFGGLPALTTALDLGDWMRRGWNDFVLGYDAGRQRDLLRRLGGGPLAGGTLAGLFAFVTLLALAWMLWLSARDARERDPVLRAWHLLGRRYARRGLPRGRHEPAADWSSRVLPALDVRTGADLAALTRRFVEWRYARHPGDAATARALARDLRRHRPGRAAPQEPPP